MGSQWGLLGLVSLHSLPFSYQTVAADSNTLLGSLSLGSSLPGWEAEAPFLPLCLTLFLQPSWGSPDSNIKVIPGWKLVTSHMELQPGLPGDYRVECGPKWQCHGTEERLVRPSVLNGKYDCCIFINRLLINNLHVSPTSQWSKGMGCIKNSLSSKWITHPAPSPPPGVTFMCFPADFRIIRSASRQIA